LGKNLPYQTSTIILKWILGYIGTIYLQVWLYVKKAVLLNCMTENWDLLTTFVEFISGFNTICAAV
jgi:hypothetical protein